MRRIAVLAVVVASCSSDSGSAGVSSTAVSEEECRRVLQVDGGEGARIVPDCRVAGFDPVWEVRGIEAAAADYDEWRAGNAFAEGSQEDWEATYADEVAADMTVLSQLAGDAATKSGQRLVEWCGTISSTAATFAESEEATATGAPAGLKPMLMKWVAAADACAAGDVEASTELFREAVAMMDALSGEILD